MTLPVNFRKSAKKELDSAIQWYDSQQPGLGDELIAEIDRILAVVVSQPDRFPKVLRNTREALVQRFPYVIYYRVTPTCIRVVSVFHTSRDPSIWQRRR